MKVAKRRELAAGRQERFKVRVQRSCGLALLRRSVWCANSTARDQRARMRHIAMSRPRFGDPCGSELVTLHDAKEMLNAWQDGYRHDRPHNSLGHLTSSESVSTRSVQAEEATGLWRRTVRFPGGTANRILGV